MKTQSVVKILRVPKKESAFVYHTVEAMEGVTMISTLPTSPGSSTVNLELRIAPDQYEEMQAVLEMWLRENPGYTLVQDG